MIRYIADELKAAGYDILDARIVHADLSMKDYGCLTLQIILESDKGFCDCGSYCLGHGYLGAETFRGSTIGLEYIMRIMDIVGVGAFNELEGKSIRIAIKDFDKAARIIGNAVEDKWFDSESFFKSPEEEIQREGKTLQKPLVCRNAHCGAMCCKMTIEMMHQLTHGVPEKCPNYERRDDLYRKVEISKKIKETREYIGQLKHKNTGIEGYRWWNNAIENCLHELDRLVENIESED